jgi:hypothetical protein
MPMCYRLPLVAQPVGYRGLQAYERSVQGSARTDSRKFAHIKEPHTHD